jgi:hypothetical protein
MENRLGKFWHSFGLVESGRMLMKWGAFYLFIANFFATQIIGGAKELLVLL